MELMPFCLGSSFCRSAAGLKRVANAIACEDHFQW